MTIENAFNDLKLLHQGRPLTGAATRDNAVTLLSYLLKAGITTSIKLKTSNLQNATCKLQQASCKKSYYNYHKTRKLQELRRDYFNAQLSVAISLPCRLKLKSCSYNRNLSRAVMRVGEWLQQIAHLNILKHVG
jgi:hypothetical protein